MSNDKYQLFDDLASSLALLSDADRGEFAQYLVENYSYTAGELARDIGFAEMDAQYSPFDTYELFQTSRESLLT